MWRQTVWWERKLDLKTRLDKSWLVYFRYTFFLFFFISGQAVEEVSYSSFPLNGLLHFYPFRVTYNIAECKQNTSWYHLHYNSYKKSFHLQNNARIYWNARSCLRYVTPTLLPWPSFIPPSFSFTIHLKFRSQTSLILNIQLISHLFSIIYNGCQFLSAFSIYTCSVCFYLFKNNWILVLLSL